MSFPVKNVLMQGWSLDASVLSQVAKIFAMFGLTRTAALLVILMISSPSAISNQITTMSAIPTASYSYYSERCNGKHGPYGSEGAALTNGVNIEYTPTGCSWTVQSQTEWAGKAERYRVVGEVRSAQRTNKEQKLVVIAH